MSAADLPWRERNRVHIAGLRAILEAAAPRDPWADAWGALPEGVRRIVLAAAGLNASVGYLGVRPWADLDPSKQIAVKGAVLRLRGLLGGLPS